VIRSSIDKFLKCGDLKEGFARVKCKDCGEEFFVAFSCRQRSCCPSYDQKRALLLGHRLKVEVLAEVPHRQWVFTIPKRLRVYFRYDRKLLGKLCRAAYDTVCDVYALEIDGDDSKYPTGCRIVYRASKGKCFPFPKTGDPVMPERCVAPVQTLMDGITRNFEVFDSLDFLAEVTQHIPNKGEHQIRYYGWYSNKKRGMQEKRVAAPGQPEPDTAFHRKCRLTWAALIKCVYEVDPLKCPKCGGEMRIVSFIEEASIIRKILKHCGLWKEQAPRPPLEGKPPPEVEEPKFDYGFFEKTCA
jgi:hypothetical protein